MKKEQFTQAAHESLDRLIARVLEGDLADTYNLRLTSISAHSNEALKPATYSETLVEITDGSWECDKQYFRESIIELQVMLGSKERTT